MRALFLALLLGACSPAPPPPPQQQGVRVITGAEAHAEAARAWANVVNTPLAAGVWTTNADETIASFGGDESSPAFTLGCTRGFFELQRLFARPHGLDPHNGAPLTILTPREKIDYTATVGLERDSARLWLAAGIADFRLDHLVASQEGFVVQTNGDTMRFSSDPLLARVLKNCRDRSAAFQN